MAIFRKAGMREGRSTTQSAPQGSYQTMQSDDSAPSTYANRGRNQAEDPHGYAWGPSSDAPPVKMEFEPEQYNTDVLRQNWRGASKYISSDETEEEIVTYRSRNTGIQDKVDSKRLAEARVQNQKLLLDTHRVIKQEPDAHRNIKQEPDDHPPQQRDPRPPPQQMDTQRTPNTNTPATQGQPPHYYHQRGTPRNDTNREYHPG